jgi:hypothetical protein
MTSAATASRLSKAGARKLEAKGIISRETVLTSLLRSRRGKEIETSGEG